MPIPGTEPDYRFTYANERTFLAWIRTSVGLIGLGLIVAQLLPADGVPGGSFTIGLPLIALGAATALGALRQHRANDRAMRDERPLPTAPMLPCIAAALAVLALSFVLVLLATS